MNIRYTNEALFDYADETISNDVELGNSNEATGVVLPHWVYGGRLMSAASARKLGAQLLRAADLHDAIQANA